MMLLAGLSFRRATQDDFELRRGIYRDVGSWLHDEKGITGQWEREMSEGEAQSLIDSSEVYLVFLDSVPAAAVRLSSRRGSIWAEAEGDALYVHELAVRRRFSGIGLGRQILELASDMAREEGKQFLRLDCMYENPRLRQYYADCGFRFLGQHPQHAWYALFEKELT